MASIREIIDNADSFLENTEGILGDIEQITDVGKQVTRTGRKAIRVANHGITARERIVSSQKQRDKEAAGEIRKNYIRYWNRALTIWGLMFTITLVIIVFF